jgi:hypothetical protein
VDGLGEQVQRGSLCWRSDGQRRRQSAVEHVTAPLGVMRDPSCVSSVIEKLLRALLLEQLFEFQSVRVHRMKVVGIGGKKKNMTYLAVTRTPVNPDDAHVSPVYIAPAASRSRKL